MSKELFKTPHEYMAYLDGRGEAYWLSALTLSNGDTFEAQTDVLSHTADWLRVLSNDQSVWINAAHVVSLQIAEG